MKLGDTLILIVADGAKMANKIGFVTEIKSEYFEITYKDYDGNLKTDQLDKVTLKAIGSGSNYKIATCEISDLIKK